MPLPTERTVTGKYVNPVTGEPYDGTNGQNYVIFEPVPDRWTDQTGNQILLGGGRVNLAADGTFAEDVVCTDVDGVLPEDGRLWRLRQYIGGTWAEAQYIKVPMGEGPLDISDLLSVDLCGVEYVPVPGPKGDPGQQGEPGPQGKPGLDGGLDTGITSGGDLTPNASNPLAVDISPLTGRIVDYSTDPVTVTPVEVAATTTVELDSIAQTRAVTWLLMGSDGSVFQQEARPSPEDRRNFLALGVVVQDGGSIVLAQSIPTLIEQPVNQFYDFLDAIGAFNMSGNTISPNGANLMLDHSSGQVFSRGWNHFDGVAKTKNPHIVTTVGASPAPWVHVLRDSPLTPSTATTTVDVGHYDADGVLAPAVGGAVVHQLWIFPTSDGAEIHVLQYGQQVFDSLAEAIDGAAVTPITPNPALPGNAVLLAYLAVTPDATDLSDPTQAQVVAASRFGGGSSAGGGGGDVSGYARLSGAEFTGPIGTRMDAAEDIAQYSRTTTDTQDRFRRLSDGTQQWGDGSAPPDAELRRLAAGLLGFLGTDLLVGQADAKAYRMSQSGEVLDFEGAGADLILSVYELANFASTQHAYLRLESATRLAHALGKWIFSDTPLGAAVHTLDGEANQLGFHGATPVGQQTVTGDRSTGDALYSLLQALDAVGLISDTSTPGTPPVRTVNGEEGPDVTLDAANIGAIPAEEKGAADGVATLDAASKLPLGQVPDLPASQISSGTFASARIPDLSSKYLTVDRRGAVFGVAPLSGTGMVPFNFVDSLPASKINAGVFDRARIPDLSGTYLTPAQASTLYSTKDSLVFNAKEHGALADGTTDDQPVIQGLLNSSPAGSTVILPPGTYGTNAPIVVPPGKTLRGMRTNLMGVVGLYDPQVCIKPLSTFTGVAAIRFLDQAEGGYTAISGEQRVLDLMLDGVNVTAGADGIQAKGNIQNVALRDVTIARFPNSGIYCGLGGDNIAPYSWRMHRVMLDNNHTHGMYGDRMVDLTAVDCQAIGNWSNGFMFGNSANSQLIGCRAEWNGNHGFYLTGDWGLGAGAGGALLSGCSTDRNGYNGVFIDVVGTNAPLVISGLMTRRDGRNGGAGGGGYAGVAALNSSMPLIIGDWTNFPGTDDDGTQANSPEFGGSFDNCDHVQIDNAYLHADVKGLNDAGNNRALRLGSAITYGVGTTETLVRTPAHSNQITVAASDSRTKKGADYVCTGVDDHLVIQQAIDLVNAAPGKGTVRLLDGTFNLGATLSVPPGAGLRIVGSGWGTVLKNAPASNIYAITFAGPGETRAHFADLTVDGNLTAQTAGGGIWAPGAVECVFQNLHVTACYDTGLYLGPQADNAFGHNNHVSQCLFDNAMASPGAGRGIRTQSNDENFIVACDFQFLGGATAQAAGVYDQAGTQTILGCNFVGGGNSMPAVRVQDAAATKIMGCNFDGVGGDAVFLAASNCVVQGNIIFGVGVIGTAGAYTGIHLEYAATNNLVSGNSIASADANGAAHSLIREESVGDSGNNSIIGNVLITKGTMTVGPLDLNAPGTLVRANRGGGVLGDPPPPIREFAGPVSDASFPANRPPANGTLGIDSANRRLYARIGGTWSYQSFAATARALPGARFVAASNAPAADKQVADYVCDGTADNVEIQAAIDAAQAEGGGVVILSAGNFNLAATLVINGTTNEDDAKTVTLLGQGQQVTELTVASGVTGITISNWAQVNLDSFCLFISGAGIGIKSVGVTSGNTMSFWHSSFRNLRINGGFVATSTTWGMELDVPWRSVFENIEIEGCRNGIKIINNSTVQNAGDCVFSRFFVEIVGNDGYALYFDSIDGNMNQNIWDMFEAGANGSGCTGIYLGGAVGTASQRFYGLNLEQFQTLINVANGESNEFYCNYVTADSGQAGNKAFVCGSNSYNNLFQAKWVNVETNGTLQVIEDLNTTSAAPNIFERIRIENNNGGTVTYTKSSSTVIRDIVSFNTGNPLPAGLLQYPLSTVNDPTFTPSDHGLVTWTTEPSSLGSTNTLATGTVYLCKVKIVNRSTVVSNILMGITNTPTNLTAGQNVAGLYNSSGTLLAQTADQTSNWLSAGLKTMPLTAPVTLAVGTYYVAFLSNGTGTQPSIFSAGGFSSAVNAGLSTGQARFLNTAAGNTALPATITLSAQSTNIASRWAALN
jgi:hypothetical protein